jgi:hypothetical protein
MRWAGYVALLRESRNLFKVLKGNPERKRRLGRFRFKSVYPREGGGGVDWIYLAQINRHVVGSCKRCNYP